jgi:twitching motility protein PilJ
MTSDYAPGHCPGYGEKTMVFQLPKFGARSASAKVAEPAPGTGVSRVAQQRENPQSAQQSSPAPLPMIGRFRVAQQLQILVALLALIALIAALIVFADFRSATQGTAYVSAAGEMRMLSQRIGKATQTALLGNAPAFRQLLQARDRFAQAADVLMQGGDWGGISVPPTSDALMPTLEPLARDWERIERDLQLVLAQQKNLAGLATAVRSINSNNPTLVELAEQIQAARLAANAPAHEISALAQLVTLTQRLGRGENRLLGAESVEADISAAMAKDAAAFGELLRSIGESSRAGELDAATLDRLAKLESAYRDFQQALDGILANVQALVNAKDAGRRVVEGSEALLADTEKLVSAYQAELSGRAIHFAALAVLALLGAAVGWLMVKTYADDQRRRAAQAHLEREKASQLNRANEAAILQLMNEMQTLAEGDLTVKATVSEAVTGAIADAVNVTVEELRELVGRITDAADRVTAATEAAQQTSSRLLGAAEYQMREMRDTGTAMLSMAEAMNGMSSSTAQSAGVARTSVAAAQKGEHAVRNAISGMNDIRAQIQETSKRIKRLGESSQEIGEIVELISDITERTNVLALNAAIQAASAGEAGRGFSVVAEEVQRLAERGAQATKQIGAIVKTIQSDTQDTVAAMERSTQGVVEGARLSDAAGQALAEIGEVSKRLAQLIGEISSAAQKQATGATAMAGNMQDIMKITQQTTEGTQRTALSIGQLTQLAQELKGSVSRFRMS